MSNDTVTVVTHQSYFSRIGDSFKAMLFGPLLIVGAIALLIMNEGNAVATHRSLTEASKVTVTVDSTDTVDSTYEGRLVHLVGRAETSAQLQDDLFGVAPSDYPLKLQRKVEMYQWVEHKHSETKKETGGSTTTTTTYSYSKEWGSSVVDSNSFQDSTNHQNTNYMAYQGNTFTADPILLGAFTLPYVVINRMNWYTGYSESLSVDNITDEEIRSTAQLYNSGFYIGQSPSSPQVGDLRVTFSVVKSQTISIVAEQVSDSFSAYPTNTGRSVLLVESGTHSAMEMFQHAQTQATAVAWLLRLVGFVIMYLGFVSLAKPLSTFADVLPFLGNLVGGATSCIMFPVALALSLTVIALSWIAVRPFVAIPILLAIAGGVYYFVQRQRRETATWIPEAYAVGDYVDPEHQTNYQDYSEKETERTKADSKLTREAEKANRDMIFDLLMKRKQLQDAGISDAVIDEQLPLP
jgi:hypothetical protein